MAVRDYGCPPIVATTGIQTNPTVATVMADIGASPTGGLYELRIVLGASVAATWEIQHRNAANSANIAPAPYVVYTPANQSGEYVLTLNLAPSERVRVMMNAGITGTAAASIQAEVVI